MTGRLRARIPSLAVKAFARVSNDAHFCARSFALGATKPVRKSAHHDLTCVR